MKTKNIILIILAIILGIIGGFLLVKKEIVYSIIVFIFAAFFLILSIRELTEKKDGYKAELSRILKTYDTILLEVEALPKVSDKKIIRTRYFRDLVNVQYELKKPIYYLQQPLSCDFIIMTEAEAYIYTIKRNEGYISKTEEIEQNIQNPVN